MASCGERLLRFNRKGRYTIYRVLYPKQQGYKVSSTEAAAEQIPQPYSRAEESARELTGFRNDSFQLRPSRPLR